MSNTETPLRLSDLKKNDLIWITSPCNRLGQVIGPSKIEQISPGDRSTQGKPRIELHDAVVVKVTVPCVPIEGVISKSKAKQGNNILKGLIGADEDSPFDNRVWYELWSERAVGVVEHKNGLATISESRLRPQLYCHAIQNENAETVVGPGVQPRADAIQLRTSGMVGAEVKGRKINPKQVDRDPFAASLVCGQPEEAVQA